MCSHSLQCFDKNCFLKINVLVNTFSPKSSIPHNKKCDVYQTKQITIHYKGSCKMLPLMLCAIYKCASKVQRYPSNRCTVSLPEQSSIVPNTADPDPCHAGQCSVFHEHFTAWHFSTSVAQNLSGTSLANIWTSNQIVYPYHNDFLCPVTLLVKHHIKYQLLFCYSLDISIIRTIFPA